MWHIGGVGARVVHRHHHRDRRHHHHHHHLRLTAPTFPSPDPKHNGINPNAICKLLWQKYKLTAAKKRTSIFG